MTTTHNTIERTLRATVARGNHEQHEAITILLNMEPALREAENDITMGMGLGSSQPGKMTPFPSDRGRGVVKNLVILPNRIYP